MRSIHFALLGGLSFLLTACGDGGGGQGPRTLDMIVKEAGIPPEGATMVIKRLSDDFSWVMNSERAEWEHPPASTAKIPHLLIALELGYAEPETNFVWDGQQRLIDAWNKDQTLTSAFQRSAVWVFQRITTDLGPQVMADQLKNLNYGNGDVGEPDDITLYWLVGPLGITAKQQVAFLERYIEGELELSEETYKASKPVMLMNEAPRYALYGKTGWRSVSGDPDLGWFVGWLDLRDDIYVFAFNLDMTEPDMASLRTELVLEALTEIGAL